MEKAPDQTTYGVPLVSVVGDGFCVPYSVELTVKKKNHGFFDSNYEVLDVNGHLFLQVSGSFRNFQKKRVTRNASGFPLLTMREKVLMPRHRWTVHRGEGSERNDLIFSVQRSNSLQVMRFRHEVFLASNINEDVPNFQAVESHTCRSYRVYKDRLRVHVGKLLERHKKLQAQDLSGRRLCFHGGFGCSPKRK